MSDHIHSGDYLSGDGDGLELSAAERTRLDRVRTQLSSEALWDEPTPEGQFRLLAAAAAEAAGGAAPGDVGLVRDAPPVPAARPKIDTSSNVEPISLDERRHRGSQAKSFGAGLLAAAAVAVVVAIGVTRLTSIGDPSDEDNLLEVAATYQLTATELDPDTIGELDVMPTVAGVQFELRLMGLDNTTGDDYYAAWLMPTDEAGEMASMDAIPLGSFHWRAGGVPIILWSGVDDPTYNRFMVTRQVKGDLGVRSDQVVLMGDVPTLTAEG